MTLRFHPCSGRCRSVISIQKEGLSLASDKKQSFLHGAALLAGATAIVKVLGALYKIPLGNIIDDAGFGYFNTAYDIYSVLLMRFHGGPAGGHEPDDCRGWEAWGATGRSGGFTRQLCAFSWAWAWLVPY